MVTKLVIKINSKCITIIEGKYSNNLIKVKKIMEIETPLQSYDNGSIKDSAKLASTIERCLKANKIKSKEVVFLINSSNIITRITKLPYVAGISDNLSMIRFELEQSMPIDLSQYNFIYKVNNRFKEGNIEKAEYVIHGILKEMCDDYVALAEKAGLKAAAIDMSFNNFELLEESKALINNKSNISNKINGFLYMDTDTTVFSVMDNGINDFSRVIDKSLVTLENDFQIRFNMNDKDFLDYIAKTDVSDNNLLADEIENSKLTSLRISLEMCVEEVNRYIKYYNSKNKGISIDKIYIYGAYSKLKNIDKYLSTVLGVQIERIEDLSIVQCMEIDKEKISDNFENLLGFYSGVKKLQFLSLQNKAKNKSFNRLVVGLVVVVPCVAALALYGYSYISDYSFYKNETEKMNTYINNQVTLDIAKEVEGINSRIADMSKYADIVQNAESVIKQIDIVDTDKFKGISDSLPTDTYIQSVQIGQEEGSNKLYIQCLSANLASIAQFEKNLKDLDFVESSFITTINNGDSYTYVIICELKEVNVNEAE